MQVCLQVGVMGFRKMGNLRMREVSYIGRPRQRVGLRIEPELDDLLDWLEVIPLETENKQANGLLETWNCLGAKLKQSLERLQRLMRRAEELEARTEPTRRIEAYIRRNLGTELPRQLELEATSVRSYYIQRYGRSYSPYTMALQLRASDLKRAVKYGEHLTFDLAQLVATAEGRALLKHIGLKNIAFEPHYSYNRVREEILKIIGTQNLVW